MLQVDCFCLVTSKREGGNNSTPEFGWSNMTVIGFFFLFLKKKCGGFLCRVPPLQCSRAAMLAPQSHSWSSQLRWKKKKREKLLGIFKHCFPFMSYILPSSIPILGKKKKLPQPPRLIHHSFILLLSRVISFFIFIRLFWNQIFTCLSVKFKSPATSRRRSLVRYML